MPFRFLFDDLHRNNRHRGSKKDYYRLNDAINSLSAGMLNVTTGLVFKLGIYTLIYTHIALLSFPAEALWVWVLAIILGGCPRIDCPAAKTANWSKNTLSLVK